MKRQFHISYIGFLIVSLAGCSETKQPASEALHTNQTKVVTETTPVPTRTPLPPNVSEDADGNLIKPDGWPIQEIIPKETRRRPETGKTKKGRTVIFNVLSITPEGRPVAEAVSPNESDKEWRIYEVDELSGRDGKIFCYVYGVTLFPRNGNSNGFATASGYRLCDYDGDGKYELNGFIYPKLTVPDWVKSLPGDPAAINSNANW